MQPFFAPQGEWAKAVQLYIDPAQWDNVGGSDNPLVDLWGSAHRLQE